MFASRRNFLSTPCSRTWPDRVPIGIALVRASCLSYFGRMTATTISFRADEQTMAELRQLAGDGNLSDLPGLILQVLHRLPEVQLIAIALKLPVVSLKL